MKKIRIEIEVLEQVGGSDVNVYLNDKLVEKELNLSEYGLNIIFEKVKREIKGLMK
jgi:hypothetical protein